MGLGGDKAMNKITELREKYGLTQRGLAKMCGASNTALYKIEHEIVQPTGKMLKALSYAFAVSADYLLGNTDRGFFAIYMIDGRAMPEILTEREVEYYKDKGDLEEIVRDNGVERFITGKTALEYFAKRDSAEACHGNSPNDDDFSETEKKLMREISRLPSDKFAIIKSLVEEFTKDANNAKNVKK